MYQEAYLYFLCGRFRTPDGEGLFMWCHLAVREILFHKCCIIVVLSLKTLLALKEDNVSYLYSSAFAMGQNEGIKHKDIRVQFEMAFEPIICRLSGSEENIC